MISSTGICASIDMVTCLDSCNSFQTAPKYRCLSVYPPAALPSNKRTGRAGRFPDCTSASSPCRVLVCGGASRFAFRQRSPPLHQPVAQAEANRPHDKPRENIGDVVIAPVHRRHEHAQEERKE